MEHNLIYQAYLEVVAIRGDECFDENGNKVVVDPAVIKEAEDKNNQLLMVSEARKNEYPSIEDQLDDLFHNGFDGWKTSIQAIKDKYPKV